MQCTVTVSPQGTVDLTPVHTQRLRDCCGVTLPLVWTAGVDAVHMTLARRTDGETRVGSLVKLKEEPLVWLMPSCAFANGATRDWDQVTVVRFRIHMSPSAQISHVAQLCNGVRPLRQQEGHDAWVRADAVEAAGTALLRSLFLHPAHVAAAMLPHVPCRSIVGVVGTVPITADTPCAGGSSTALRAVGSTVHLHVPALQTNHILAEVWVHASMMHGAWITMRCSSRHSGAAVPRSSFVPESDASVAMLPPVFPTQWWFRADRVLMPDARVAIDIQPATTAAGAGLLPPPSCVNVVALYLEVPEPFANVSPPAHEGGNQLAVKTATSISTRAVEEDGFSVTRWHLAPKSHMTASCSALVAADTTCTAGSTQTGGAPATPPPRVQV